MQNEISIKHFEITAITVKINNSIINYAITELNKARKNIIYIRLMKAEITQIVIKFAEDTKIIS